MPAVDTGLPDTIRLYYVVGSTRTYYLNLWQCCDDQLDLRYSNVYVTIKDFYNKLDSQAILNTTVDVPDPSSGMVKFTVSLPNIPNEYRQYSVELKAIYATGANEVLAQGTFTTIPTGIRRIV